MASTILYKFRSGTTFEALPLPGSAARLFDVKKGIVKAKKLDAGSMEFDLSVRNADTNEEYTNESMLLPRGTRLVVQRLPAARGHGFLARMARNEHAGAAPGGSTQHPSAVPGASVPGGFYTIDSRTRDDDDEFVQSSAAADDDKELAALQAVTRMRPSEGPAMTGGYSGGGGRGGPSQGGPGGGAGRGNFKPNFRPNADPELREQEKKLMPKKRATGIPRTFLNLSAPPQTDGSKEGEENESSVPLLQPNTLGFKELVNRGGGQSESTSGTRHDLDYALKLTATTIPEFLQCAICHSVVRNAVLLSWDPEGRTTCESCIRDALTQNGFRCPLTGMEGVSPDELPPNRGLRNAADAFIKEVMKKIDEIEKQQVEEAANMDEGITDGVTGGKVLEADGVEKGVILSKRTALNARKKSEDDPFGGGDDDFGGDVFAVEADKAEEEEERKDENVKNEEAKKQETVEPEPMETAEKESDSHSQDKDSTNDETKIKPDQSVSHNDKDLHVSNETTNADGSHADNPSSEKQQDTPTHQRDRRERRRGPPVGYAMGPAGGAVGGPKVQNGKESQSPDPGYHGGRGRGYHSPSGGGGRGQFNDRGGGFRGRGRDRGRGRGWYGGRGDFEGGGRGAFQEATDTVSVERSTVVACLKILRSCDISQGCTSNAAGGNDSILHFSLCTKGKLGYYLSLGVVTRLICCKLFAH